MSSALPMDALFTSLRDAERTARTRLLAGCEDDARRIDRYFERPLHNARAEAIALLAGMGAALEPELSGSLRHEGFEEIGRRCAERVFANVDLRLRARMRIYTGALAEIEMQIASAIASVQRVPSKHPLPRMFSTPRLAIDDLALPNAPAEVAEVPAWIKRLRARIAAELRERIDEALERVLVRGKERLGIVKTRIDLALFAPADARIRG